MGESTTGRQDKETAEDLTCDDNQEGGKSTRVNDNKYSKSAASSRKISPMKSQAELRI